MTYVYNNIKDSNCCLVITPTSPHCQLYGIQAALDADYSYAGLDIALSVSFCVSVTWMNPQNGSTNRDVIWFGERNRRTWDH